MLSQPPQPLPVRPCEKGRRIWSSIGRAPWRLLCIQLFRQKASYGGAPDVLPVDSSLIIAPAVNHSPARDHNFCVLCDSECQCVWHHKFLLLPNTRFHHCPRQLIVGTSSNISMSSAMSMLMSSWQSAHHLTRSSISPSSPTPYSHLRHRHSRNTA